MANPSLKKVSEDLLSILPLIIRSTHRKLLRSAVNYIDVNITPLHFEIIRLLDEEGPRHAKIVTERLQIAKAQMTQLTNKLVEMGLVKRTTDPADRRNIIISLTPQGKAILDEHKNLLITSIQDTLSRLSEAELMELSLSVKNLQTILMRLP